MEGPQAYFITQFLLSLSNASPTHNGLLNFLGTKATAGFGIAPMLLRNHARAYNELGHFLIVNFFWGWSLSFTHGIIVMFTHTHMLTPQRPHINS